MTAHGADVSNAALQVTSGIDRTLVAAIDMVHATVSRRAAKPTAAVHSTDVDDAPILAAFGAVAERAGALPSPLGRSLGDGDAARLIEERVRHWEGAVRAASETLHACLERTSSLATAPVPSLEQRVWRGTGRAGC